MPMPPWNWLKPPLSRIWWLKAPLFDEDASTVSHVYWRNGALVDSKGLGWSMLGTVPQVAGSGKTPPGAGPFSASNAYRLVTEQLHFAANWSIFMLFTPADLTNTQRIADGSNGAATGWDLLVNGTAGKFSAENRGAGMTTAPNSMVASVVNCGCVSQNGTTQTVVLNAGTAQSGTNAYTQNVGAVTYLGSFQNSTQWMLGTLFEFYATTQTYTSTQMQTICATIRTRAGISAW